MNKQKKIETNNLLINTWYAMISARGYFDYWLTDYEILEQEIMQMFPKISKTYIHNAFWKHVYSDKGFLEKYEY